MAITSWGFSIAVSTRAASISFSHVFPTLMMWMPSWRRRQMYSSIMWSELRVPMWHWADNIFWMSSSFGARIEFAMAAGFLSVYRGG